MKTIIKTFSLAAGILSAGAALQSCALDQPFGGDNEGQLQMKLVINSDLTRSETNQDDLSSNCIVYISGQKGLLHKYLGLENLPESLTLKSGHYVAEAWAGDSVSASFDKKFFRGYQPFEITTGLTPVVVNCKIANVVASVNAATVDMSLVKELKVNVANSRASLDFTQDNFDYAKGYFMMPSDDNSLKVTVSGVNISGESFSREEVINDVERAHEYILNFAYNPEYQEEGGSFITINVDDSEILVESEVEIYGRPRIGGVGFDADKQIVGNEGDFAEHVLKVNAFGGIKNMIFSSDDFADFLMPERKIDLKHCTQEVADALKESGFDWDESHNEERNLSTSFIHLSATLLNQLKERNQEYSLLIDVTDDYGKTTSQTIRFAVGEGAVVIEDPVMLQEPNFENNRMALGSTRAILSATLVDPEALNPGIAYRESGTTSWTVVKADDAVVNAVAKRRGMSPARVLKAGGKTFNVTLTGLKPSTRYEYRAVADGFESESKFFTTESKFIIPNASLELWSNFKDNSKVLLPGDGGQRTFWDSGNHGSATMSVTLTQGSSDMAHSGQLSAKLRSQFVSFVGIGKFAAGNLFAGTYLETQGTDGRLEFGREYDSSHPSALRVYVNYRPMIADKNGSKNGYLKQGDLDKGQIYVALTTEKVEIRTKKSNQKLWNTDDPCVIAYGEKIFTENFGPDGSLQELNIPLTYKASAAKEKPLYLVIVCTASYYGDFFDGGEGSTMYVDDFELVYE